MLVSTRPSATSAIWPKTIGRYISCPAAIARRMAITSSMPLIGRTTDSFPSFKPWKAANAVKNMTRQAKTRSGQLAGFESDGMISVQTKGRSPMVPEAPI